MQTPYVHCDSLELTLMNFYCYTFEEIIACDNKQSEAIGEEMGEYEEYGYLSRHECLGNHPA
jgi:hypothetical protein